jgi:maltoporin
VLALMGFPGFEAAAQTPEDGAAAGPRERERHYEERIANLEERLRALEAGATNGPGAVAGRAVSDAQSQSNAAAARAYAAQQYQEQTESRDYALRAGEQPVRERVEKVLQDFVDITGYFRAGFGRNNQGGPQVGYQAPGAASKYRLGNEAETYGELTFGKNFFVPGTFALDAERRPDDAPTGPVARVQTTFSIYNPYQDLLASSGTDFGLPELWASIGNVVDAQPAMKFWAGYRFYRRHDIHISDFFFYNMSGAGGGMEDLQLPVGRLALAWIGAASPSGISSAPSPDANNEAGFSKANWDLRWYDVPLPGGKGEFGLVYARSGSGQDLNGNTAPDADGLALTLLHTRDQFLSRDGVNKISVQVGQGAARTFTAGFDTFTATNGVFIRPEDQDSWRFRVTEHFTANLSEHFSIGPALVYQFTDFDADGGQVHWASAGVRPIWHFNRYVSLAFEGGVDWVKDEEADTTGNVFKLTLAPQVSLGNRFMSRPVIRGFVTYARWSEDFVGSVGGNDYLNEDHGVTYGVQMEVWW